MTTHAPPPPVPALERVAFGMVEAAEAVGLPAMRVIRAVAAGDLTAHVDDGQVLVLREDLVAWIRGMATVASEYLQGRRQ